MNYLLFEDRPGGRRALRENRKKINFWLFLEKIKERVKNILLLFWGMETE